MLQRPLLEFHSRNRLLHYGWDVFRFSVVELPNHVTSLPDSRNVFELRRGAEVNLAGHGARQGSSCLPGGIELAGDGIWSEWAVTEGTVVGSQGGTKGRGSGGLKEPVERVVLAQTDTDVAIHRGVTMMSLCNASS